MAYDAVKMLELSRVLAAKEGFSLKVVMAIRRFCEERNFSPEATQKIFETGIERGRDALIAQLYKTGKEKKIGLRQIGDCLNLSHESVRLILKQRAVERLPKGRVGKWRPVFESLGEEEVLQVMYKVATEPRFWGGGRGGLQVWPVLKELGFPKLSSTTRTRIWQRIVEGFGLETHKVGIIIRYRMEQDPHAFLEGRHWKEGKSLPEIADEINLTGVVQVCWEAVRNYMKAMGIPILGKGRRDGVWFKRFKKLD